MARRHEITDYQWDAIKDFLPGKDGDPGATAKDNRLFVNAIMWIAKTGAPWRDLPERFGNWNSVFQRFNRWCKTGVFQTIMEKLQDPDLGVLLLDSTIIRAHQHAAAKRNCVNSDRVEHRTLSGRPLVGNDPGAPPFNPPGEKVPAKP